VAAAAATALGAVGRPQDLGALAAASLDYFPLEVRRAALEAIGHLGVERGAVPVLLRHLEDPHAQVAEAAAAALVAVGPSGHEALREYSLVPAAGTALALARLRGVVPG
jgi:HEAT repeat protein